MSTGATIAIVGGVVAVGVVAVILLRPKTAAAPTVAKKTGGTPSAGTLIANLGGSLVSRLGGDAINSLEDTFTDWLS